MKGKVKKTLKPGLKVIKMEAGLCRSECCSTSPVQSAGKLNLSLGMATDFSHRANKMMMIISNTYCKTCIFRVPFILQIS